jgi:hypothetical protein
MNQTALGWGVPSADTVVSHTMRSVLRSRSAYLPNGVLVSISFCGATDLSWNHNRLARHYTHGPATITLRSLNCATR